MFKKDKPESSYKFIYRMNKILDKDNKILNQTTYKPNTSIIVKRHAMERYAERFLNIPKSEISEYIKNNKLTVIHDIVKNIELSTVPIIQISEKQRQHINKKHNINSLIFLQYLDKIFICRNPRYKRIIVVTCYKISNGIILLERSSK